MPPLSPGNFEAVLRGNALPRVLQVLLDLAQQRLFSGLQAQLCATSQGCRPEGAPPFPNTPPDHGTALVEHAGRAQEESAWPWCCTG